MACGLQEFANVLKEEEEIIAFLNVFSSRQNTHYISSTAHLIWTQDDNWENFSKDIVQEMHQIGLTFHNNFRAKITYFILGVLTSIQSSESGQNSDSP